MTKLERVFARIHAGDKVRFRQDFYGGDFASTHSRFWSWLPWRPTTWIKLTTQEVHVAKEALDKRRGTQRGKTTGTRWHP